MEKTIRVAKTIYINNDIHNDIKLYAVNNNVNIQEAYEFLIKKGLKNVNKK